MATIGLIAVIIMGFALLVYWIGVTGFMFCGLGPNKKDDYIFYAVITIVLLGLSGLCFYHAFQHFHLKITI